MFLFHAENAEEDAEFAVKADLTQSRKDRIEDAKKKGFIPLAVKLIKC